MNYDFSNWDWMNDNDFMTYKQLIERLRIDLNEPDFFAYDLFVPHNEQEYLETLSDNKKIVQLLKNSPLINFDSTEEKQTELKKLRALLSEKEIIGKNGCQ